MKKLIITAIIFIVSLAWAGIGNKNLEFGHKDWFINSVFGLPMTDFSALPSPSAYQSGLVYDRTNNFLRYSNGAGWYRLWDNVPADTTVGIAVPFIYVARKITTKTGADTTQADTVVFFTNPPFKLQVIDCWIIGWGDNRGTFTLRVGANSISNTITLGDDYAIARATTINYINSKISGTSSLIGVFSAASDSAIVYISAIPVK